MSAPLKQRQQVSLRGASAKEITRDALLQKVSLERELRSYTRRASAAALCIQRVWRRYCVMKKEAELLKEEWETLANKDNIPLTSWWISNSLLRPFLFFATHSPNLHQKLQFRNATCMSMCFKILLQSINSAELEKNFCSLAVGGTLTEKATWSYQAQKLISLCCFILSEFNPICHDGEDAVLLTVMGMQLLVSLTDPMAWKCVNGENIREAGVPVKKLIGFMTTRKNGLYTCIRRYLSKLDAEVDSQKKTGSLTDNRFLITASAITLALRPFHAKKLGIDDLNLVDVKDAAEQYCTCILTVPCLMQRLPRVLLPALRHESSLLPCLKVQLISKDKIFAEMLKLEQSELSCSCTEKIPCMGWALANIINLATEYNDELGDSVRFTEGLDFMLYVQVISCISENFLHWLENSGGLTKNENDEFIGTCDSSSVSVNPEILDRGRTHGSLKVSCIGLLKPVYQQWHLRGLLAMIKKENFVPKADTSSANQIFESSGKMELLDIVFLYYYMLRIFSFLNPLVGSLPILNMLSFTPGFLVELWEKLEGCIFCGNGDISNDDVLRRDGKSGCPNEVIRKEQRQILKDTGNKWVNVLQKITGKTMEVGSCHSNNISLSRQVDEGVSGLWVIKPLSRGPQGISTDLSCMLHLFCAAYAHLLLVLDDIEFYDKQVPFTIEQQQRISSVLNNLVYGWYIHSGGQNNKPLMDVAIRCLHLLYERDCRHKFCPSSLWVGPAQKDRLPIAAAARAHEVAFTNLRSGESSTVPRMGSVITTMPHVFPFEERVQIFREFIKLDKASRRVAGEFSGPGSGSIEIVVRRDHIVEDGFKQLNFLGSRLRSCFNVSFVSECGLPEAGLDYGGLSKEFLTDLSRTAFGPDYGLFSQTSTSERLLIPNTSARFLENGIEMIEFFGRIVGKALYEGILLDYSFCLAFVQKLLGRYSFLDELSTLDPELYRNLMYVKHYDGDVKELSLDFTITEELCGKRFVTELKPGGRNVSVTNENKLQYVHAVADYKLNRQILPLANAFYRGLIDLISPSWLSLFNANEFNQLLSGGNHDFDVDDLRSNTRYTGGYSEGSRTVKLFWEVIKGFKSDERCMLLKFVTSCFRAPLLGFKHLQPTFTIHKVSCDVPLWAMVGGQDVDRLPSASTCYNTLKLPTYKRPSTLRNKLLYAISSNTGFELS